MTPWNFWSGDRVEENIVVEIDGKQFISVPKTNFACLGTMQSDRGLTS